MFRSGCAPGRIITIRSLRLNDELFFVLPQQSVFAGLLPPHFYPHDHIEEGASRRTARSAAAPLHPYRQILEEFMGSLPNPDNLRDMLAQVMRLLAEQGLADKELILTEWNSTAYQGIDE